MRMLRKLSILLLFIVLSHVAVAQDAPLYSSETFSLYPRQIVEGKNHADIVADNALTSTLDHRKWIQQALTGRFPQFACDMTVSNTLYNLSLDELTTLWGKDGSLHASKLRDEVWTRDLSYGTFLSLALIDPTAAQASLMARVWQGKILQDDGTGGAWPVSTDRAVWVLGAWEVYLVTGDRQWLKQCYEIVRHSLMQDENMIYDSQTGLVRGEMSVAGIRKEVYPLWMQPADIAQSECLSTNALFFRANEIAAKMARMSGDNTSSQHFMQTAQRIKEGINNHLWIESRGYYSQYRYGRVNQIVSQRSETLGEALCILFGIADPQRVQQLSQSVESTPYGVTCFAPQIPDVYAYHNNALWPYVQAYWLWAVAQAKCPQAVTYGIASIYRTAALMATNMENAVATTGTTATASNSANSLLSIAANLSIPLRVFAGIEMTDEGMTFRPLVPKGWANNKQLNNLKYRKAILDINVQGYGDRVRACYVDGKKQKDAFVPSSLTGKHSVRLVMNNEFGRYDMFATQEVTFSPSTPNAWMDGATRMSWQQVAGAKEYKILRNGSVIALQPESRIEGNYFDIQDEEGYAEYQVVAVDSNGLESFASEPLIHFGVGNELQYDMSAFAAPSTFEQCRGYGCSGAVEISSTQNTRIEIPLDVPAEGDYLVDFRYANGSGSPLSGNSCASRMLWCNGKRVGSIVFPQRGKDIWNNWGYSTSVRVHLNQGPQTLLLIYEMDNQNMSPMDVNRAMLDHIRLIPLQ